MSVPQFTPRPRLSPSRLVLGSRKPYLGRRGWNLILVVLILLVGAWATWASPNFLTANQLSNAAEGTAVSALLALGLTLVVLVGEIDISLTSNLACCTVVTGLLAQAGVSSAIIIVMSLLTGALLGLFNGAMVGFLGLPSLAVTLGTMGAYQGLAFIVGGDTGFTQFPSAVFQLGFGTVGKVPVSLIVFVGVALAVSAILNLTTLGRSFYAIGRSAEATRRTGISVPTGVTLAFTMSGLIAGLAALVFVGFYGSGGGDSASGTILTVVTAVALGGVDIYGGSGQLSGVVLAVALLLVIQSGMAVINLSTTVQTIVIGSLLILSLAVSRAMGGGAWRSRLLARVSQLRRGREEGSMP